MLCTVCLSLSYEDWTSQSEVRLKVIKHQPSWAHLAASAAAGCQLCSLFELCLLNRCLFVGAVYEEGNEKKLNWTLKDSRKEIEGRKQAQDCVELSSAYSHQPLIDGFHISGGGEYDHIEVVINHGRLLST